VPSSLAVGLFLAILLDLIVLLKLKLEQLLHLKFLDLHLFFIEKGTKFYTILNSHYYIFTVEASQLVYPSSGDPTLYISDLITLVDGEPLSHQWTIEESQEGALKQRFILPNSGVDTNLLSVSVRNNQQSSTSVKYSLQDSLFNINSQSEVYFIQEIENEQYELIFGDGVFGKALEDNNYIEVNYNYNEWLILQMV
jgi:hypothetical protein